MTLHIYNDVDLTPFNTMGFSVRASSYVAVESDDALVSFLLAHEHAEQPIGLFVLGGGSNVVFTRDVSGLVLHMRQRGIRCVSETAHHISVAVAAGEVWHEWVKYSIAHGWLGLENLALIPGSVGACPVQNIGAYGVEIKDHIECITAWDRQCGTWVQFTPADAQFSYRDSVFKQPWVNVDGCAQSRYLITEVQFKLLKDATQWQPKLAYADVAAKAQALAGNAPISAKNVMDAVISIRQAKLPDPTHLGNVGSFFKNPLLSAAAAKTLQLQYPNVPCYPQLDGTVKVAAGWLIEQAGFKGLRDGSVGVYERQALVLVHHGGGTGEQLLALAQRICDRVWLLFGIQISPEPVVY